MSEFHGDGSSLSIEETNKIRIQLGLKPLEDSNETSNDAQSDGQSGQRTDNFVHVPAINIGQIKQQEKLSNRIKMRREDRQLEEMLASEKTLSEGDQESTNDFLKIVTMKRTADQARKMQEDEGEIEDSDEGEVDTEQRYQSHDLSGLAIEHKASRFDSLGVTVLTLKDKGVLDDDREDVLVNVNLLDHERAEKNVRNKRMGAYGDYIDSGDEDDPLSSIKPISVLSKYDEVIDGEKRNRFTLDAKGRYGMDQEKAEEELRQSIFTGKRQSFSTEVKVASDFITAVDIGKKYRRKARGMRKTKAVLKAESIEESSKQKTEEGELAEEEVINNPVKQEKNARNSMTNFSSDDDDDDVRPALVFREVESVAINDEIKQKISFMKKSQPKVHSEAKIVRQDQEIQQPSSNDKKVTLTRTEEYTKSIFNILQTKRKMEAEVVPQMIEEPVIKPAPPAPPKKIEIKEEEEPMQSSGWQPEEKILSLPPQPIKKKRNIREPPVQPAPQEKKKLKLTDGVLGDEVQINSGIYSTLLLVKNKGYLEEKKSSTLISNPKNKLLRAQHYQEEKIRYDDIDQKCPRRERRNLPESPFQDKTDFVPDIKLDYHDEFGRPQPPKEAFRSLSHRFHGKTSGKIKSEKRFKKLQEQSKLTSSFGDMELKRNEKMHTKMKSENRYCVPLSGKNSIIPAAIKKTEKK